MLKPCTTLVALRTTMTTLSPLRTWTGPPLKPVFVSILAAVTERWIVRTPHATVTRATTARTTRSARLTAAQLSAPGPQPSSTTSSTFVMPGSLTAELGERLLPPQLAGQPAEGGLASGTGGAGRGGGGSVGAGVVCGFHSCSFQRHGTTSVSRFANSSKQM